MRGKLANKGGEPEREAGMPQVDIDAAALVDDVMRRRPGTIRAFLDRRMNCPGCPIACFHTVADACREHHANVESFLRDLHKAAA